MRTASIEDGRFRLFVLAELLSARLAVGRDVHYERFGDGLSGRD